jgi:hypothetical protein
MGRGAGAHGGLIALAFLSCTRTSVRVMHPSQKGAVAEIAIALEATKLGILVLKPMFEGGRYDLVFDFGGRLSRIQCKWAVKRGDVVEIRTGTSRRGPEGFVRTTYGPDEVDAIVGYCAVLDRSYLLPISMAAGRSVFYLRLTASKNNQRVGVNWACDYELGAIAQLGERAAGSRKVVGSSPTSSTAKPPPGAALF